MQQMDFDPVEYFIGHGHTDMHARHSYITAHIFYEDLRKIQDSLPPADIYEALKTNAETDELCLDENGNIALEGNSALGLSFTSMNIAEESKSERKLHSKL